MLEIIGYANYAIGIGALIGVVQHFYMTRKAPSMPVDDSLLVYAPIATCDPNHVAEVV